MAGEVDGALDVLGLDISGIVVLRHEQGNEQASSRQFCIVLRELVVAV